MLNNYCCRLASAILGFGFLVELMSKDHRTTARKRLRSSGLRHCGARPRLKRRLGTCACGARRLHAARYKQLPPSHRENLWMGESYSRKRYVDKMGLGHPKGTPKTLKAVVKKRKWVSNGVRDTVLQMDYYLFRIIIYLTMVVKVFFARQWFLVY